MNEIEKLYDNAGVETNKYKLCCTGCKHIARVEVINGCPSEWFCDKYDEVANCDKAEPDYPFTAEKQLELIKWLARHNFVVCKNLGGWHTGINPTYDEDFGITCSKRATKLGSFEYALAGLINNLWQDLTEEEKEQIRRILNG